MFDAPIRLMPRPILELQRGAFAPLKHAATATVRSCARNNATAAWAAPRALRRCVGRGSSPAQHGRQSASTTERGRAGGHGEARARAAHHAELGGGIQKAATQVHASPLHPSTYQFCVAAGARARF